MSIGKKLFRGVFWNAIAQFGSQAMNFVILIVLARLLEPAEFGIVGMVTVFTAFLGFFTEFGLTPSLIREKEVDEIDCSTVFWGTVVLALVIYAVVYASAPLVAAFYGEPRLVLVTRVLFTNFLFAPLAFVPEVLEKRSLHYDKIAKADLISLSVSGAAGIGLAFLGFGHWSLVIQQIILTFLRGVALMLFTGWLPRSAFSWERFHKFSGFGFHFTVRNLMTYLLTNLDSLLVGKLLGPAALGIYSLALRISKYPVFKLWAIFGQMMFPAFASFQDDLEKVRRNLLRVSLAGGLLLVPFFVALFFGIEPFILLVFGEKWLPAAPVVKIFIFYLSFEGISLADDALMTVFNQLKLINAVAIGISAFLFLGGYFAILHYGILGMAGAFTAASVLNLWTVKGLLLARLRIKTREYLAGLRPLFVLAGALSVFLWIYSAAAAAIRLTFWFLIGEALIAAAVILIWLQTMGFIRWKEKKLRLEPLLTD